MRTDDVSTSPTSRAAARCSRPRLALALALVIAALVPATSAHASLRAPGLLSPAPNVTVPSVPAITWGAVRGATQYEYQLAADRRFASIVLGSGKGRGTSRTANLAATLDKTIPDGDYFWRVRAIDKKARAGRWSRARSFTKSWATAPQLLGPSDALSVSWPSLPLVLSWSSVPYAAKYNVTIATDPQLSSPVLGSLASPQQTQATVFALPSTLAPGPYYWGVTPVDAEGIKGRPSRVGSFVWNWPTATPTRFTDLSDDPGVVDPQLSWDPAPGAARYEVEINPADGFPVGSKVCCTDLTIGTSLSPTKILGNNTYHWRVRAIDSDGNAGQWNVGPDFTKTFDQVAGQSSITGLRVGDNTTDKLPGSPPSTSSPVIQWDPVPGATGYEVQGYPWTGTGCDVTNSDTTKTWNDFTATNAWTPLSQTTPPTNPGPGPSAWGRPEKGNMPAVGTTYCVRVLAYTDDEGLTKDPLNKPAVISRWTELAPAFTLTSAAVTAGTIGETPAGAYAGPAGSTPRNPVFRWQPVDNAGGYYVVVARDPSFTDVIDYAFTRVPAYAPRFGVSRIHRTKTYADETTSYYWAVIPSDQYGGTVSSNELPPDYGNPQSFEKASVPPALLAPAGGADVTTQPTFRWKAAEGARSYQLQVSQDPSFGNPIDDVTTTSTAYTSSATYPADTVLYWRVRANADSGVGLAWSGTDTFQRRLPVPVPSTGNPTGGENIPVVSWSPVPGAVSYGVNVDQVDGTSKDFTVRSTAFSPTLWYGTGIWRWRVRANFPTGTGATTVAGGYFGPQDFLRLLGAPKGAVGVKQGAHIIVSWDPDPAATRYQVDLSPTNSFSTIVESTRTDSVQWAPALTSPAIRGKPLYWRVAAVDSGNNVGAYASGKIGSLKALRLRLVGHAPRRGRRSRVTLSVSDNKRRRLRGVLVRLSGVGIDSVSHRSGRRGKVTFTIRPRRGMLVFRGTARGYRTARYRLKVR